MRRPANLASLLFRIFPAFVTAAVSVAALVSVGAVASVVFASAVDASALAVYSEFVRGEGTTDAVLLSEESVTGSITSAIGTLGLSITGILRTKAANGVLAVSAPARAATSVILTNILLSAYYPESVLPLTRKPNFIAFSKLKLSLAPFILRTWF